MSRISYVDPEGILVLFSSSEDLSDVLSREGVLGS